jgi:hypothetical protein
MKRVTLIVGILMLLGAVALQAQTPAAKPGPETQRLGYFLGTWVMEGDSKDSPLSKAGKMSGTEVVSWYEGGFFLVLNGEMQTPTGRSKYMVVKGWNPDGKAHQAFSIGSTGTSGQAPKIGVRQASVSDKTWTTTWETVLAGKAYHIRMTQIELSPTSYTERNEYSTDNKTWVIYLDKKFTKR